MDFSFWEFNSDGEWIKNIYKLPIDLDLDVMMFKESDYWSRDINDFKSDEEQNRFKEYWSIIGDITYAMMLKLFTEIKNVEGRYNLKLVGFEIDNEYAMMDRGYLLFVEYNI